jgi:hypothetical protein
MRRRERPQPLETLGRGRGTRQRVRHSRRVGAALTTKVALIEAVCQAAVVRRLLRDQLGLAPSSANRALVAPLLGRPLDVITDRSTVAG